MVLSKHFLGPVGQLPNGVGVVIHGLLKDHVALEHQHGTLLVLERGKKRRMRRRRKKNSSEIMQKKGDRRLHIKAKQNTPNELSIEGATYKKRVNLIEGRPNHVIMLMHAVPLVICTT